MSSPGIYVLPSANPLAKLFHYVTVEGRREKELENVGAFY